MDKQIELTKEQKETKEFIRFMYKIMLYVPFFMILFIVISLIIKGLRVGFY
jgi:hypothetical protein